MSNSKIKKFDLKFKTLVGRKRVMSSSHDNVLDIPHEENSAPLYSYYAEDFNSYMGDNIKDIIRFSNDISHKTKNIPSTVRFAKLIVDLFKENPHSRFVVFAGTQRSIKKAKDDYDSYNRSIHNRHYESNFTNSSKKNYYMSVIYPFIHAFQEYDDMKAFVKSFFNNEMKDVNSDDKKKLYCFYLNNIDVDTLKLDENDIKTKGITKIGENVFKPSKIETNTLYNKLKNHDCNFNIMSSSKESFGDYALKIVISSSVYKKDCEKLLCLFNKEKDNVQITRSRRNHYRIIAFTNDVKFLNRAKLYNINLIRLPFDYNVVFSEKAKFLDIKED